MRHFIGILIVAFAGSMLLAVGDAAGETTAIGAWHSISSALALDGAGGAGIGAGLAAGIGAVGAGIGIGMIGSKSNEAVARQPEMAGRIFINMILTAALVEGVALFAVIVGVIAIGKVP